MISLTALRKETLYIKERLRVKRWNDEALIDDILALDERIRSARTQLEEAQATMNKYARNPEANTRPHELKSFIKEQQTLLLTLERERTEKLRQLPNPPHEKVPQGAHAKDNICLRQQGVLFTQAEKPLPHWELAQHLRLFNFELGAKVSAAGFPFFMGNGARLVRSLIHYFLEYNTRAGYIEYHCPLMVNEASVLGTGQLPDKEEQMYVVGKDNFYLIPTAEVPLTNLYRDCIVKEADLPIKMTAYTPCFRREAGSYGKDTRGLNRMHQFDKVEIVQLVQPEKSMQVLDEMVAHVEGLLQSLDLPYRIVLLCGGDMGFASHITYDFEVYAPAQDKWLEVSSVSNFSDFQANRMKARYKTKQGKTLTLHTLNGSSLALPRIIAALLENGQTAQRGLILPEALRTYLGTDKWEA